MASTKILTSMLTETLNELQKSFEITTEKMMRKYPTMNEMFKSLERTTGLNTNNVILLLVSIPFALFGLLYFTPIALSFITLVYPLYMSIKCIEDNKEGTRWLIYWILYNTAAALESIFGVVLTVIPFYHLIRGCYFVWCMSPVVNNGSIVTYYVMKPFLLRPLCFADMYFTDAASKIQDVAALTAAVYEKENTKTE